MKKVRVLMVITILLSAFVFFTSYVHAAGETMTLWGMQTAGSGHAKNAKTDGNTLVLTTTATITDIKGDAQGYCIWTIVTPQNRTARSVLCGGKGRQNIIGKTLGPGSYRVIPGLYGKSVARITITLK